ncbi:hypothetical protein [Streptomyces sp. NPDC018833]
MPSRPHLEWIWLVRTAWVSPYAGPDSHPVSRTGTVALEPSG